MNKQARRMSTSAQRKSSSQARTPDSGTAQAVAGGGRRGLRSSPLVSARLPVIVKNQKTIIPNVCGWLSSQQPYRYSWVDNYCE
jgi:hypothetical protein